MNASVSLQKNAWATRRFSWLMKVSSWLQNIPNKVTPAPFRLMQIGSQFWQSRALYTVTKLDIATHIGNEQLSIKEIAKRANTHSDATYRILRMLAAMEIFEEVKPRQFRNNKLSNFLRQDHPKNIRAMILMHNSDTMYQPWYEQLEQGIRTNSVPFRQSHGEDLFSYMDHHKEFDALFSQAMDCVEALSGNSFATDVDWGSFDRVIDLGGSKGSKSAAILKRHPHLHALIVDRPQIIQQAIQYWENNTDNSIHPRLQFQAGDLLQSVPEAASEKDIYLLCAVLHAFDDETCINILQNVAKASGETGAPIAIMELVLSDVNADLPSTMFDMQMLMGTQGRERTLQEWRSIFNKSGLVLDEVVKLQSLGNILVLRNKY
jgi:O-methyltransferase domain/Dimerisation domain